MTAGFLRTASLGDIGALGRLVMTKDGSYKRQVRRQARAAGVPYTKTLADRRLLDAQVAFYDERAPDFGDGENSDRLGAPHDSAMLRRGQVEEAVRRLHPSGDVLELACGPGTFTATLARYATSLTAVDASPRMLARSRASVDGPSVHYIEADIFGWQPPSTYDVVFFGHWLSHVPLTLFDEFWELIARCLRPGGRVGFVDESDRARRLDLTGVANGTPTATRALADGRTFEIVKIFWSPSDLQERLRAIDWDVTVEPFGDTTLIGIGRPPAGI